VENRASRDQRRCDTWGNLVLSATAGIRVFTGALTGAVLAALDDDPQVPARLDKISQAIDYLGTGFPLAARPPATTP
jgi:hypothetical protein